MLLLRRLLVLHSRGSKPAALSGRHLSDIKSAELSFSMPPALKLQILVAAARLATTWSGHPLRSATHAQGSLDCESSRQMMNKKHGI